MDSRHWNPGVQANDNAVIKVNFVFVASIIISVFFFFLPFLFESVKSIHCLRVFC